MIRVLLVEDNPEDALLIRESLSESSVRFKVHVARSISKAGAALREAEFDVVLLDLSLPDSHGLATFEELKKQASRLPIIVLSGQDDEALALKTVELGAQDYLVKGQANEALLVRAIRYAIRRAELDNALLGERNLLRSVIDNLIDAICVKDLGGRILLGNRAQAVQLGFSSPESLAGRKTEDFFPADVATRIRAEDERVIATGESLLNQQEPIMDNGVAVKWISTTKVPLRNPGGEIIGLISIGRDITPRKLAEEQLAKYTTELREKNAEMEDDLNMAREVQQAFLPQQFPVIPPDAPAEQSAVRFYSKYLPTTTLGGDFFHVLPISPSKVGVFICDVMGHGVRAALVTAIHRALVEELTPYADDPSEFLTQMNSALLSILRRTRSPMFASAFYVVVDLATARMRYANAGHPRPLLLRRSENSVSLIDGPGLRPGPALGVFDGSKYAAQESAIAPKDVIILFTDGLYEVENARGELYDPALLLRAVEKRGLLPVEQVFEHTLEEVRRFSATHAFVDDVCLVGIEIVRTLTDTSAKGSRSKTVSALST